jgi:hypothetical protein
LSGDEIQLTLPADEAFHRVAHLVLGGLPCGSNLTFESLEDLELALDALLERRRTDDGDRSRARLDGELQTVVGPFASVRAELEQARRRARPVAHPRRRLRQRRDLRPRRLGVGRADEAREKRGRGGERVRQGSPRRYHEEGDLQAREQLIEQYMSLVRSLARATRTAASSSRISSRSARSA